MMDSTTILLLPPTSTTLRYGDDPINMDGGWRLDADGGCVGGVGVFSDDDAARRTMTSFEMAGRGVWQCWRWRKWRKWREESGANNIVARCRAQRRLLEDEDPGP